MVLTAGWHEPNRFSYRKSISTKRIGEGREISARGGNGVSDILDFSGRDLFKDAGINASYDRVAAFIVVWIEVPMAGMKHQELFKGLIRLHILHHASESEFYGQWMIHELASHGYTLSAGTLYPMLHALERRGYLKSRKVRSGRTFRRVYRATALGREANRLVKVKVRELVGELRVRAIRPAAE